MPNSTASRHAQLKGFMGQFNKLVSKLLTENIPCNTFEQISVSLILWIDAFYSAGVERTYVKVALSAPVFRRGKTNLLKWIEVEGFESSLMEFAEDIDKGKCPITHHCLSDQVCRSWRVSACEDRSSTMED
jgi:hypothetical protein